MYTSAVLKTAKDALVNSALSELVKPNEIFISYDDSPGTAVIGRYFIMLHPMDRANPNIKADLTYFDQLTFGVTVGYHGRDIPKDRIAEFLYGNEKSVGTNIEILRDCSIIVLNSINDVSTRIANYYTSLSSVLPSSIYNIIYSKLSILDKIRYISSDATPVLRYPSYFNSSQSTEDEPRPAGFTLTTVFRAPQLAVKTSC